MKGGDRIHVGTSGWQYDDWAGAFYPDELSRDEWLTYYTEQFETVEVNNTFYNVPSLESVERWRQRAPEGFEYTLKAHRYITHRKKLIDPDQTLPAFLEVAEALGDRIGVLLFQLPPKWHANPERLASFLEAVPDRYRCAVEFRDPSWYDDAIYQVLDDADAAFCVHDMIDRASPKVVTADFAYARFHGAAGQYHGKYDTPTLSGWAGTFAAWLDRVDQIYAYFNNDAYAAAPENAAKLRDMVR